MYRFIRAALLLAFASTTVSAQSLDFLQNKKVIVDVSGVLFDQDMLGAVYSDTSFPVSEQLDVDTIFHHPLMIRLLGMAQQHRPFGAPEQWYNEAAFPYELFVLFTGLVPTSTGYSKFVEMLINNGVPTNDPLYQFVTSLFDHENFNQHMSAVPESIELLDALKAVPGIQLIFYSNMPQGFVEKHSKLIQLAERYDAQIITASHIGQIKPSTIFFAQLLPYLNDRVENLVLIDDKHEDLLAAQSNAITTLHFDRPSNLLSGVTGIVWRGSTTDEVDAEIAPIATRDDLTTQLAAAQEQLVTSVREITDAATARIEALLAEIKALLTPAAPESPQQEHSNTDDV